MILVEGPDGPHGHFAIRNQKSARRHTVQGGVKLKLVSCDAMCARWRSDGEGRGAGGRRNDTGLRFTRGSRGDGACELSVDERVTGCDRGRVRVAVGSGLTGGDFTMISNQLRFLRCEIRNRTNRTVRRAPRLARGSALRSAPARPRTAPRRSAKRDDRCAPLRKRSTAGSSGSCLHAHGSEATLDDTLRLLDHPRKESVAAGHILNQAHHRAARPHARLGVTSLLEARPIVLHVRRERGER